MKNVAKYCAFPSVELEVEMMSKVVKLLDWKPSFGVYGIDEESLLFHDYSKLHLSPKECIFTSKIN
jgi:hypothetical protein